MRRKIAVALTASLFAMPATKALLFAKESEQHEQNESGLEQQKEEQRALDKYNKVVAKHGKDSAQAKRAWKRYQHELKEHGHSAAANP